MTKATVLKTMVSYMTPTAARACLCHGPVPPALASSLLLQTPIQMSVSVLEDRIHQLLLTSCQVLMLLVFGTEPIFQQTATSHSFLMRMVVKIMQPLVIDDWFQSGAE